MGEPTCAADLCVNCGLCCTDAMFGYLEIDDDDRARLVAGGYPADQLAEGRMPLPCPLLEGTRCTIYGRRPAGCGTYRCEVLKAAEAGAITVAQAWRKVLEARRLLARLRGGLPPGVTVAQSHARWNPRFGAAATADAQGSEARLAYFAYAFYIDRHFRSARKRVLAIDSARPRD